MEKFHIITRCTRPQYLKYIKENLIQFEAFDITWWVIFDIKKVSKVDSQIIKLLMNKNIRTIFHEGEEGCFGSDLIDHVLGEISDGWVYILDDDNKIHPEMFVELKNNWHENPHKRAFIFHQEVSGKDFTGLDVRYTGIDDVKVGKIDTAQFIVKRDLIGETNYNQGAGYISDGVFIQSIFEKNPQEFHFIDKVLSYYNFFQKEFRGFLPKVMLVGSDSQLTTSKFADWESDQLLQLNLENDEDVDRHLSEFNPDSIITIGEDFGKFPRLSHHSLDVRRRWIHFNQIQDNVGEVAFQCAMNYILNSDDPNTPLISFFTPTYNTGDKIWKVYKSLQCQTYTNWEWVIVDDSNDSDYTLSIVEKISRLDCRVKVYSFHKKSGGIIGESKWRCASMCRGKWIVELDHDDLLTPDAGEMCVKAFTTFTDCKFVYSDCVEVDSNDNSLTYGDGFAWGYGSYREVEYEGKKWQVANCVNINPKTIRHIVGVPNHLRAWDREFYFKIGGHNRRLSIADDYELIVRTFLNTRMVRIPKMLYIQYYHGSNSQNVSRSDIQRRVRWISSHYNERIKNRFEQLGVKDWAWEGNPQNPTWVESRFGETEGRVNYIMDLDLPTYNWSNTSSDMSSYHFQI